MPHKMTFAFNLKNKRTCDDSIVAPETPDYQLRKFGYFVSRSLAIALRRLMVS